MASYAPLMAHVDAWQWKPDEIWFDNLRSYGTPNYYVQSVFANNAGTRVVPSRPTPKTASTPAPRSTSAPMKSS
jgi:alpha-N-arabinofuranosidase